MRETNKQAFSIILLLIFIGFNLLHIYFPIHLIIEDIKLGTINGTNLEMGALFPWSIEFISIPFIFLHLVYYFFFRKTKYTNKIGTIVFIFYLFQVLLFNILLFA